MSTGMKAKLPWRIIMTNEGVVAEFHEQDGTPLMSVGGFDTKIEAGQFIALYMALMASTRKDSALEMLNNFLSKTSH